METTKDGRLLPVFKIPPETLRHIFRERADYHAKRAEEKEAVMPSLRASLETLKTGASQANPFANKASASNYQLNADDAIDRAEEDIRTHRAKSQSYEFLATHVIDDFYYLTLQEMRDYGIIKMVP